MLVAPYSALGDGEGRVWDSEINQSTTLGTQDLFVHPVSRGPFGPFIRYLNSCPGGFNPTTLTVAGNREVTF